jgi:hypothetical protein
MMTHPSRSEVLCVEQAAFDFDRSPEPPEPCVRTLVEIVRTILGRGRWYTPWELCDEIRILHGVRISDSSVTARIRDIRKPQYGGQQVELRKRENSRAYEYRLARPDEAAGKKPVSREGKDELGLRA